MNRRAKARLFIAMGGLDRRIDLLVSRLRQKPVDHTGAAALLKTVRGAGYLFDVRQVQGHMA